MAGPLVIGSHPHRRTPFFSSAGWSRLHEVKVGTTLVHERGRTTVPVWYFSPSVPGPRYRPRIEVEAGG